MPSRKPDRPVVIDGVTWLGVLRPDTGRVCFDDAVRALRRKRVQFDPHELEPAFFKNQGDGTYRPCAPSDSGVIVGWMVTT